MKKVARFLLDLARVTSWGRFSRLAWAVASAGLAVAMFANPGFAFWLLFALVLYAAFDAEVRAAEKNEP
jgi:hypothetical protein